MTPNSLVIASRKSQLAMVQSEYIKAQLRQHYPDLLIEIKGMLTQGDILLATPLNKIGGKGLFVKELEKAIFERRADIAVHSIKDMPMELPDGLTLAAICEREDPRDAFVSNNFTSLESLPAGAVVGTSSLRRQCQILSMRPDLTITSVRGNVQTRLRKLDDGEYDALIMAGAGLKRLDLENRIQMYFETNIMLPAAGQGAIGVECFMQDKKLVECVKKIDHPKSRICIEAERAITQRLGGSCQIPIGAYAKIIDNQISIQALVGWPDGHKILKADKTVAIDDAINAANLVADDLISQGAEEIIQSLSED